jgi:RNA polymerase sigma factor (sigma-70 family)
MENISDTELLQHIKDNDHSAFDTLFERYWKRLYQTAFARLNDGDIAQDIVQEIFIKIWRRRAELDIKTSFENYLHSAVRLSVISHHRSKKVNEAQLQNALERVDLFGNSIHALTGYLELEKTLQKAVNVMPEVLKKVYLLRSESHSIKAIAKQLGLADQTVKNYHAEASRRLRIILAEKYSEKYLTQ